MGNPTAGLRQRSPEWREARRHLITATDIPIILGISTYKAEGQLAREKSGELPEQESNLFMEIGQAMEPVIAAEYERQTGHKLTRFTGLVTHATLPWAAASPDARRKGKRYLVELKDTRARRWQSGELPRDVEAQVQWQLGCTGFPEADVAALRWATLEMHHVTYDQNTFDGLVVIAEDFRRRMVEGGPFQENRDSIKSRWSADDGTTIKADAELAKWVDELLMLRQLATANEKAVDELETRIKNHIATATRVDGPGWHITWKRSKQSEEVNYKNIAEGMLNAISPNAREALLNLNTTVKDGARPFRLVIDKEPT